jgi:hypothetical protein
MKIFELEDIEWLLKLVMTKRNPISQLLIRFNDIYKNDKTREKYL